MVTIKIITMLGNKEGGEVIKVDPALLLTTSSPDCAYDCIPQQKSWLCLWQ